jgi:hypothetical protein
MAADSNWEEKPCWVLYDGQDEPVGCNSVEEALNYVNAENIARGLPLVKRIQIVRGHLPSESSDFPSDQA